MNIDELIQSLKQAKRLMREHGEKALKTAFIEFFDKCPEIVEICWTQYTPYFNDGDACTFSVDDVVYHTQEHVVNEGSFAGWEYLSEICAYYDACCAQAGCEWADPPTPPRRLTEAEQRLMDAVEELLPLFGLEDLLQSTFGDHVCVRATRDGFHTEEYDHD